MPLQASHQQLPAAQRARGQDCWQPGGLQLPGAVQQWRVAGSGSGRCGWQVQGGRGQPLHWSWHAGRGMPCQRHVAVSPASVNFAMAGVAVRPAVALTGACPCLQVCLYHALTGQQEAVLGVHDGLVYSLAWSRDDQALVSASADFSSKVWHMVRRPSPALPAASTCRCGVSQPAGVGTLASGPAEAAPPSLVPAALQLHSDAAALIPETPSTRITLGRSGMLPASPGALRTGSHRGRSRDSWAMGPSSACTPVFQGGSSCCAPPGLRRRLSKMCSCACPAIGWPTRQRLRPLGPCRSHLCGPAAHLLRVRSSRTPHVRAGSRGCVRWGHVRFGQVRWRCCTSPAPPAQHHCDPLLLPPDRCDPQCCYP